MNPTQGTFCIIPLKSTRQHQSSISLSKKVTIFSIFLTELLFLSNCKSVYECNACGCLRSCVLGKVHQHLLITETIFPAWALLQKAHSRQTIEILTLAPDILLPPYKSHFPLFQRFRNFVQIIHGKIKINKPLFY